MISELRAGSTALSLGRMGWARAAMLRCLGLIAIVTVACAGAGCSVGEGLARDLVSYGHARPDGPATARRIAARPIGEVKGAVDILLEDGALEEVLLIGDILTELELHGVIHGRPFGVLENPAMPRNPQWLCRVLIETERREISYFLFDVAAFHPDARRVLRDAARNGASSLHRRTALYILARSARPGKDDLELIVSSLADRDADVRTRAAVSAGELKIGEALAGLLGMLDDRTEAKSVLVDDCPFIGRGVLPVADAADFRPELRSVAAWAIQQITGRDFGYKTAYESRDQLDAIILRIRSEYPSK